MSRETFAAIGLFALCFALPTALRAQDKGVVGVWQEAEGSVIRVAPCGADICARLVKISPREHFKVDGENPDAAKRTRPLCNLEIGSGFHLTDADHAEDGYLYDPKSGKTYHGSMTADGDHLNLRGYIGIKAFGRTEHWTRLPGGFKDSCS